jgi:hypothetical protein
VQTVERSVVRLQVPAERRPRLGDATGGGQFDQVGRLVVAQVALGHEFQPDRRRDHALREIGAREAVPVVEELDHEVVAGVIVHVHGDEG